MDFYDEIGMISSKDWYELRNHSSINNHALDSLRYSIISTPTRISKSKSLLNLLTLNKEGEVNEMNYEDMKLVDYEKWGSWVIPAHVTKEVIEKLLSMDMDSKRCIPKNVIRKCFSIDCSSDSCILAGANSERRGRLELYSKQTYGSILLTSNDIEGRNNMLQFQKGDRVKVIEEGGGHNYKIGEEYIVEEVRTTNYSLRSVCGGWTGNYIRDKNLEAAGSTKKKVKPVGIPARIGMDISANGYEGKVISVTPTFCIYIDSSNTERTAKWHEVGAIVRPPSKARA